MKYNVDMNYDPDDIDKDSQGFRIYCDDNANKLDTKHCHWHYKGMRI